MNNFVYYNPTRIVFGKGTIADLKALIPADQTVLMTYGGGAIKRNGVYEQVKSALSGRRVIEFGGIQPNPLYEHLMDAVKIVRKEQVGFLLAVGGGSVLDGTKFIAAAARYEGDDPWDILARNAPVKSAVALGAVLTLPATGSESNFFAVVSRHSTQEKLAFGSEHVYPRFSVLDPQVTMSLPQNQVRTGIVDAFVHVMEQYATYPVHAALQDRQAEAILATLIEQGPITLRNPADYDARANFMWSATQALNGLISVGVPQDWGTHMIGHELTAFYGVAHAESLAIVMPALLRHEKERKAAKLLQFARRVWKVTDASDSAAIEAGIVKMEEFFHSLGMPTHLADYNISPADAAKKIGDRFDQRGSKGGEHGDLGGKEAREILLAC
ncbi:MAG TPA: iron-containing alcohol dehydrogenase [Tepidisphaeraceae bacterium]|nr:iron-containing alcohol dehydrogenase [Tepidisphaeraceae bacterium]